MLYLYYTFYPYEKQDRQKNFEIMNIYRKKLLDYAFVKHTGKNFDVNNIMKKKNGKPYLKDSDLYFNISHTNGLICCGISDTEIGVDCEHIREFNTALLDKVCTPTEKHAILSNTDINRAFFAHWTLKESYCKFTGNGLSEKLKNIEFTITDEKALANTENTYFLFEYIGEFVISICSADKYLHCRHKYCCVNFA